MANTTIIIGAGASCDFGLPSGQKLKGIIASILDCANRYGQEYLSMSNALEHYLHINREGNNEAAWRIKCSSIAKSLPLAISIDNYIDTHRGDKIIEQCGKLAIVISILEAEKKSALRACNDFEPLENTWIVRLFKLLTENHNVEEVEKRLRSLTLIVFNYDRCIEHFFYHAFQRYYDIQARQAAHLVKQITIYHPYGQVGCLPWQGGPNSVNFGEDLRADKIVDIASSIKTFTESVDEDESHIIDIRKRYDTSSTLIFLGFAYAELNLKLLSKGPSGHSFLRGDVKHIYGTAWGHSKSNSENIFHELRAPFGMNCQPQIRNDLKCAELLDEYSRSIKF